MNSSARTLPRRAHLIRISALAALCCAPLLAFDALSARAAEEVSAEEFFALSGRSEMRLAPGASADLAAPKLPPGAVVELEAEIDQARLDENDRVAVSLSAEGQRAVGKSLNAGDPAMCVPIRVARGGAAKLAAKNDSPREIKLSLSLRRIELPGDDALALEAEPNNAWTEAQPMRVGRAVYGNGDDADYLDNRDERPVKNYANGLDNPVRDRVGLDWFRIDCDYEKPKLVLLELDVLDRDVSVNLRMYTAKADGSDVELYLDGKDPMEIVHDREPERYSKAITRTLKKGTYYLQVNGNHPRYTLRSEAYEPPPYANPQDAVRVGMRYIMDVGDAWVAQVPREGNIYRRVQNMHDTATRCTACHPSIFSTEATLEAKKAGYPIEAKSQFRYVVDRIYNGPSPMYGPAEVNWQRYIAIPLQSQGKHGGILMDFEKWISGRETPMFLRYAPFLRKAWTGGQESLLKTQTDEANGVVPADSIVGIQVRDWKVLTEAYQRTGDRSYLQAATNIEEILTGPKCDQKNIQDKIHRIWGLSALGLETGAYKRLREDAIDELMSLQNADGGWPDIIEPGRASAVYTTGQAVWTLTQAGKTLESLPTLRKAVDYILSQQQPFGGWFQTTTHENFQTPMRETRYAVMALAATHPLGPASPGWGNRGGGEARAPRRGNLIETLDDLDRLWDVLDGKREELTQAIAPLLADAEPLVRATAAETLGRIGSSASIAPLIKSLADPVKDVMRSAAWSARQFGNRGEGIDAIKTELASFNPAARRGAARVFAYHYFGMDERLDVAHELMKLADDDVFWTRLEALKSLRQWFYRTGENAFKREVVDLYIERMGVPEHSAIRTNLAQGMYIMLDENEAGGVSLERNLARFPDERDREASIAARRHVEQAALLEPVLAALADGNELQREALLASFDGSFFAGRFYAQNPRNMIDVGNDREFGFYYQPPEKTLDRVFENLLGAGLPPRERAETIELASFFFVPKESESPAIQGALLGALSDRDEAPRKAAVRSVREDLALKGAEARPAIADKIAALLADPSEEIREAALLAAARNDKLLHEPRIAAFVQKAAEDGRPDGVVLASIHSDLIDDARATELLEEMFSRSESEDLRLRIVDRLFDRASLAAAAKPSRELVRLLRAMAVDPVTGVRERLLERLEKAEALRANSRIAPVLYGGLSDASAGIRLRSLKLALGQEGFWKNSESVEYLLKLLLDPDAKIRNLALESAEKSGALAGEPRLARRVKALATDKDLGAKAVALLAANHYNPDEIKADGAIQTFGIPDLEFFKEKVNPYFYKEGADGHSCYDCHQNHNILRIAGIPSGAKSLTDDLAIQNMNSALKVVNVGDPEQSLILRKPRSPQGQGEAPPDSPTGLVHVGGPRWPSTTDDAYQAMLAWIRDAAASNQRRIGVAGKVDSYSPDYPSVNAFDNDPNTIWHTEFVGAAPPFPHELVIDLGEASATEAFQYVPRQENSNGRLKSWEIYVSADGEKWGEPLAQGEWSDDSAVKIVPLRAEGIRFVKLRGLSSANGQPFMSAAEAIVLKAKEPKG